MSNFLLIADMEIGKQNGICAKSADIWQVVGYVLLVFKIVIPIILIVLGMIDLGKSVVSGKDDEIKKNMKSLMIRAIAAVAIFFIPTLVGLVMSIVSSFSTIEADFNVCKECISSPTGGKCNDSVKDAGKDSSSKKS